MFLRSELRSGDGSPVALRCSRKMRTAPRGFSLIEVLIATTITVVALVGLAHLFVVASAANRAARIRTMAAMLARDKIEELLAGAGPSGDGVDFIGARGEWLGDSSPPAAAVFVRRWSVSSDADFLPRSRVLSVWITSAASSIELARVVGAREGGAR